MVSRLRQGLGRQAARAVRTGRHVALPVFDGARARQWRDRDGGPLDLAAARAGWRLGGWGRARTVMLVLGADADVVTATLAAHPAVRAVPSFDLVGLKRAGLPGGRIAALMRLYAGAFRDAGGVWGDLGPVPVSESPERGVTTFVVGWPQGMDADEIAALARATAPRRLCVVQAGAGDAVHHDTLQLAADALRGQDADAVDRLLDFAGLPRAAFPADARPRSEIALDRVHLMSCLSVTYDLPLLPHYLDHYIGLGVDPANIHIILNAPDADAPGLAHAREILSARGTAPPEIWIGPYSSREMWDRRRDLQRTTTVLGDWVISADADELHVYPAGLSGTLWALRAHDADWLQGPMIDRIGPDGALAPVQPAPSLWKQFPIEGDLMCQISRRPELKDGGGTVKAMLMASYLLPGLGGHGVIRADCAKRAENMAARNGVDLEHPCSPVERGLARTANWQPAPLLGRNIGGHPRIADAAFRLSFPAYVAHFKWRDVLIGELARRRASGLQTEAASQYSSVLQDFLADSDRIDLSRMVRLRDRHRPLGWAAHLAQSRARSPRAADRQAWQLPQVQDGWRVRQLSFGSGSGLGHFHSYYDIPVLNGDETRVAAVRYDTPHRALTPDDSVAVGVVDLDGTGFRKIAETRAWSWQQGPMLQWLAGRDRLIWNDREGGRFVARMADADGGDAVTLDRPVYALTPDGKTGLSLDFARLDALPPGYGYAGGVVDEIDPVPGDNGIWRVDLDGGDATLILPIADAVAALRRVQTEAERAEHDAAGFTYWFNHCKCAPGSTRFTVKLRWRVRGGGWNGTMGVSLTCGLDGSDPRVIARASSHVIWLDDTQLYFWNQGAGHVALIPDVEITDPPRERVFDRDIFDANVHLRHVPNDPARMIFDTPYRDTVQLKAFDRNTGQASGIAQFGGHLPAKGQFRCDLHPVPTRDGTRIIMSSPADGMRQIYVAERT